MQPLPFALTEDGNDQTKPEVEALRKIHQFIAARILIGRGRRCGGIDGERDNKGRYLHNATRSSDPIHCGIAKGRTIAARLVVLNMLVDPTASKTLDYYAKRIACSRQWLSLVGKEFSASLGLMASWQRIVLTNKRKSMLRVRAMRQNPDAKESITGQALQR